MAKIVIDISKYNTISDYAKVAKQVDGVLVRAGYRSYAKGVLTEDPTFRTHIENFIKLGVPVGIYFFTTAINAAEGAAEANYAVSLVRKYKISFPIYVDTEMSNNQKNGRSDGIPRTRRTEAIVAFCERVKQLGYEAGIYASDSWFVTQLDFNKVSKYKLWVASYSKAPTRVKKYAGWQFTSNKILDGIPKRVDCSYYYDTIGSSKPSTNVTPSTPTINKLLKKGSVGEEVKWVQRELNKRGYNLVVDGEFGPKTEAAVKDYQKRNGLEVDGIVGPKTIASLEKRAITAAPASLKAAAPIKAEPVGIENPKVALETIEKLEKEIHTPAPARVEKKADPLAPGSEVVLKDVDLYTTKFSSTNSKVSGTYYITNGKVANNRVQISEKAKGRAIGWVRVENI